MDPLRESAKLMVPGLEKNLIVKVKEAARIEIFGCIFHNMIVTFKER